MPLKNRTNYSATYQVVKVLTDAESYMRRVSFLAIVSRIVFSLHQRLSNDLSVGWAVASDNTKENNKDYLF